MPDFLQEARDLFPYTQALRRDFHRHPELGFREIRTGGIVARARSQALRFCCASTWTHFPSLKRRGQNMHHKIQA
jgi:hypothetical protein